MANTLNRKTFLLTCKRKGIGALNEIADDLY
jgi:hypothetical protein